MHTFHHYNLQMSPLRDDHGRGSGSDYSEGESNRWRKKYEMEKVKVSCFQETGGFEIVYEW